MIRRFLQLVIVFGALGMPAFAFAATLSISPNSGVFSVGSTFDVDVLLNTQGQSVNAIDVSISFPPDKLQLASPATTHSIIGVWANQPTFNNQSGRIDLQGGVPHGINVSEGIITRLTFRVRSTGVAIVRFLDNSKVLLNDGLGTNALNSTEGGVFHFQLPPPAGPIVVSPTHPDQTRWYPNSSVALEWQSEVGAEGFSYILNDNPIDLPDDISEGVRTNISYKNLSDGTHFFHIKALRGGVWGGATHYALNIDAGGPAEFPVEIIPSDRTSRRRPIFQFFSTDQFSGVDHYELKIVPLSLQPNGNVSGEQLFVEAQSPYIPSEDLPIGSYDIIVRAYDKAGNYREEVQRLDIVNAVFEIIQGKGLQVRGFWTVTWPVFWTASGVLVLLLALLAFVAWKRHHNTHLQRLRKELPQDVQAQLNELKAYREKYGKAFMLLLALGMGMFFAHSVFAQTIDLSPPLLTTVSKDISSDEIFYVQGKSDTAGAEVVLYLQSLQDGTTISQTVTADKRGDWFYRHNTFLVPGNYLLWAQTRLGNVSSPPSPQIQMTVRSTAIQFGASRISFETLYLVLIALLLLVVAGLIIFIVLQLARAQKKRALFMQEIKEAEESIRRGFAILRRDIQAELAVIRKAKLASSLSREEKEREELLLKDLDRVEEYVGKEVWDIEHDELRA